MNETKLKKQISTIPANSFRQNGMIPLSSSQSRIWFMEHFDKEIVAYNIPMDFRVTGDLDIDLLEKSIRTLIRRHESLRTVFPARDGKPYQKILPTVPFTLSRIHVENESGDRLPDLIAGYSLRNAAHKFDLEKGPLFRFELLITGKNEYLFLVNFHHIVSDAISAGIFLEELKALYTSGLEGKPENLTGLSFTYADYARREKQWLESEEYKSQLEFWKKELSGAPEVLPLPTDFSRPKRMTYSGTEYHFPIPLPLRESLSALSVHSNTSLFVTMLTAFSALLSKYSLQNDFVIGVPVANRNHEELQSLVGVLINTLPIRFSYTESTTFREAIKSNSKKFLSAFAHQEVPFERLVEELKVKRNTSTSPLFQAVFNYLPDDQREIRMPGVTFSMDKGERRSAQFDLTLTLRDSKKGTDCILEYNTGLFRKETIERLAGHFLTLLTAVSSEGDLLLTRIPLLTDPEKEKMLVEWNHTHADYPSDRCVHHLFEDQVKRTPDSIAIADDREELTYAGLNARANRLARHLVKHGAREDTFVALFLDRGIDLVVALLAVAKSGSTYLPLDPIYPKARLKLILDDASPVLVLTQRSLLDLLPETGTRKIFVDERKSYLGEKDGNLNFGNPLKPAYILYTSGSTGKPKGVQIKHHSTINCVNSIGKRIRISPSDVVLAQTTIAFDVAEMEIFLPLLNGAKVVIASQETASNIEMLKSRITESGATFLFATPVTFRMLVLSSWKGKPDLKILSGGEALSKELAKQLLSLCGEVWNGYAPTETTIYSTVKKLTDADVTGDGYVTLGRPLDNTSLYILNPERIPVPVGVPGELYIGGEGVSIGYLNLPDLTRERFVPDPYSNSPGSRMYRTGDLVNYDEEGKIIFLNRIDFQVKIRGFRIELGEIESVLSQYPGIKENVVVVRQDPSGEKMLTAYYILTGESPVEVAGLKRFMKERLPEYMVPSAFVQMERFPLTATLKVDRKALPEPEVHANPLSSSYAVPRTSTEQKLASIWSSVLNIDRIGIHDDFFEIGGHSMIAVVLMVKIEKELGIRLPLATLFEQNTISGLAALIEKGNDSMRWRSLVPIRPAGTKKPLHLVHGMGLNVLLYTTVVNHLDPDQPVYGVQAKGLNGVEEPLETMEEIASHYISEIMTVDPDGPYALAGFSLGGRVAFEMAQQLVKMGKKVRFLGILDASADASWYRLPFPERQLAMLRHFSAYVTWNIVSFFSEPNETKLLVIKRKWRGLKKKITGLDFKVSREELVSQGGKNELPRYLRKVHRVNRKADRSYIIKPYNGTIHLFKAKKQTFYIPDPVNYGWDKVAAGGVIIHEIPGEHSNTFAPPNDKYFAQILQNSLNESERS